MRRAGWRLLYPFVMLTLLLAFPTVGGISLIAAGETQALPMAVAGVAGELVVMAIVVTTLGVRATMVDGTVSRRAVLGAYRAMRLTRTLVITVLAVIVIYAIFRALTGDAWTMFTALVGGVILGLMAWATKRLSRGLRDLLDRPATASTP
jgi:hypothetical protein